MDALILSCSTGGGHNAAGYAIKEELERRNHNVTMFDPYELAGNDLDKKVGGCYIKIAQNMPHLFGLVYSIGNEYRKLPFRSPVYAVNKAMLGKMQEYLQNHSYDIVFMPHLYPGEILTYMKRKNIPVPKTIFIATDYVCIPFTEEIECDYYIIPAKQLADDFIGRGIDPKKLIAAGIPVKRAFSDKISRQQAVKILGLEESKRYLLLSGGSIGAGQIEDTVGTLCEYLAIHNNYKLIMICGTNKRLFEKMRYEYGKNPQIILLESTDKIALYMKACDAYISKPGGLSSTEAAVSNTPLIHISPIPGCENKNMSFFEEHGMSVAAGNRDDRLLQALEQLQDPSFLEKMKANQRKYINPYAAEEICDFAEQLINTHF